MKTFSQFVTEVYDKDVMGSSQIKKTGEGGRIGAERKKSTPERRRMKAVGGGKMEPVEYKDRKDIGQQRQRSTREQQPEKERGSKEVAKSYADKVKERRRAEAKARIAAKASGGDTKKASSAAKVASKEAEKAATKLLTTKKKEEKKAASKPRREWKTDDGGGMTRAERDRARNKEKGAALKARKAELIKDFTEKNGRPPKGAERTKLIGLAHKAVKSGL